MIIKPISTQLNGLVNVDHLVFTFDKTRTQQLLQSSGIPFFLYDKDSLALKNSLGVVKYIIGFGDYTGSNQDTLKLESKCNNIFRNTFSEGSDKIQFDLFVLRILNVEKNNVGKIEWVMDFATGLAMSYVEKQKMSD